MRVFVTGGTGLVGSLLVKRLRERGDHVVLLSRRPEASAQFTGENVTVVVGNPTQAGPWMDALAGCDAVVNLAGEGVFNRRWSPDFKELVYTSRMQGTDNVVAGLKKAPAGARVLINASAIGYYGPHGDDELTEDSPAGISPGNATPRSDLRGAEFLAKVCIDWERAAEAAAASGVRVVLLRTGIVLDPQGGALKQLLPPFKMFAGGPVAGGKQWMSWIHKDDEVGLILFALDQPGILGPFNATAPNPATNIEFSTTLGKVLGRPSFFPTPGFMLNLMLGESAQIVTTGQRVLPVKALSAGYTFQFPDLEGALRNLLT